MSNDWCLGFVVALKLELKLLRLHWPTAVAFGTAGRKHDESKSATYTYIHTGEEAQYFHCPTYITYLQNSDFDTLHIFSSPVVLPLLPIGFDYSTFNAKLRWDMAWHWSCSEVLDDGLNEARISLFIGPTSEILHHDGFKLLPFFVVVYPLEVRTWTSRWSLIWLR